MKLRKDEMVGSLNEFLDLDINWSKLSKEDLNKIYEFFNDPKNVIKQLIDAMGLEEFIRTCNDVIAIKVVESKPVRRLINELLFGRK